MTESHGSGLERETVGALLRARRESMRLSGSALAARAGLTQSKVSRIETGQTAASPEDVRQLAEALRMAPDEVRDLVELASGPGSRAGVQQWWPQQSSQLARKQEEIQQAESAAREVRIFQPAVVPGLLQVSGYAEAVIRPWHEQWSAEAEADLVAAVAARLQRQQVLTSAERSFHFILAEAVLSHPLGHPEDMLAQIRRIREAGRRDNVTIAIIPADAPLTFPLMHGFEVLDDTYAVVDMFTSVLSTEVVSDLRLYRQIFDVLGNSATTDIEPILDKYRDLYLSLSAGR